jgi:hypothetical protein
MTTSRCGALCVFLAAVLACALGHRFPGKRVPVGEPAAGSREVAADPATERILLRIQAKDRLVADLVAGRCTLLHAAALFRELDRAQPEVRYPQADPEPPLRLPSPTEGEEYCARVIRYARNSLRTSQPALAQAVTARLVSEFWAGRHEARLPDAASLDPVRELLERP